MVIGSKILPNNCGDPERHLNGTLERLGIDCIDLYMVHWPLVSQSMAHFNADEGEIPSVEKTFEVPDIVFQCVEKKGKFLWTECHISHGFFIRPRFFSLPFSLRKKISGV